MLRMGRGEGEIFVLGRIRKRLQFLRREGKGGRMRREGRSVDSHEGEIKKKVMVDKKGEREKWGEVWIVGLGR